VTFGALTPESSTFMRSGRPVSARNLAFAQEAVASGWIRIAGISCARETRQSRFLLNALRIHPAWSWLSFSHLHGWYSPNRKRASTNRSAPRNEPKDTHAPHARHLVPTENLNVCGIPTIHFRRNEGNLGWPSRAARRAYATGTFSTNGRHTRRHFPWGFCYFPLQWAVP